MAVTKKSDIQAGEQILADAIIAFQESGVMIPLVTSASAPKGSGTVSFPYYGAPASSNVGSGTDGTDYSTTTTRTVSKAQATIAEYIVRSDITDLAKQSSPQNLTGDVGQIIGHELALKADDLLVSLFSGFSQTESSAGTSLTLAHVFGASRQLHAAGAAMPYNLVLSPKGVWGSKGLLQLLINTNSGSQMADNPTSAEALANGFVGRVAGVDVYWSAEIDEDVSSGGDAAAGMFSKGAMGMGFGFSGPISIEEQRDASARATEYVGVLNAAAVEIYDNFGVYMLHDVS